MKQRRIQILPTCHHQTVKALCNHLIIFIIAIGDQDGNPAGLRNRIKVSLIVKDSRLSVKIAASGSQSNHRFLHFFILISILLFHYNQRFKKITHFNTISTYFAYTSLVYLYQQEKEKTSCLYDNLFSYELT